MRRLVVKAGTSFLTLSTFVFVVGFFWGFFCKITRWLTSHVFDTFDLIAEEDDVGYSGRARGRESGPGNGRNV